jgi:hypothetical protein
LTGQLSDELGLSVEELQALDSEGRALITDHGLFLLVNLYGETWLAAWIPTSGTFRDQSNNGLD